MSKLAVRDSIIEFLKENTTENVIDLTGDYEEVRELLAEYNLKPDDPWLGVQFTADPEEPVSLTANGQQGLYREWGLIYLHVVMEARIGVGRQLVLRGENLLNLFRGRNIKGVVIESITPITTDRGATLEFEAGYMSGVVALDYYYDYIPNK